MERETHTEGKRVCACERKDRQVGVNNTRARRYRPRPTHAEINCCFRGNQQHTTTGKGTQVKDGVTDSSTKGATLADDLDYHNSTKVRPPRSSSDKPHHQGRGTRR